MAFFFWNATSAPSRGFSGMNLQIGALKVKGSAIRENGVPGKAAEAFALKECDHVDFHQGVLR